jgi:hypothetical protein
MTTYWVQLNNRQRYIANIIRKHVAESYRHSVWSDTCGKMDVQHAVDEQQEFQCRLWWFEVPR